MKTLLTLTLGLVTVTSLRADQFHDALADFVAIGKRPSLTTQDIQDYESAHKQLMDVIKKTDSAIVSNWVRQEQEIIARKIEGLSPWEVCEDEDDDETLTSQLLDLEFLIISTDSNIDQALEDYRNLLHQVSAVEPNTKLFVSSDCPCGDEENSTQVHEPECIFSILMKLDDSNEIQIKDGALALLGKKGSYTDKDTYILSQFL